MRLLAVALTVLALAASGCSGDDPDDTGTTTASESSPTETPPAPEETETSEEPDESDAEPTGATDPCTLVTNTDVNAAFGVKVGPGEPGTGQHDDGDVSYTSTDCEWEAEEQLEVQLSVSTADDFGGELACTPVSYLGEEGAPTKVPGAESATWLASEDPNEIEARLRVCTSTVTMDLELDAATGTGVDTLRQQTIDLATKAVAALG